MCLSWCVEVALFNGIAIGACLLSHTGIAATDRVPSLLGHCRPKLFQRSSSHPSVHRSIHPVPIHLVTVWLRLLRIGLPLPEGRARENSVCGEVKKTIKSSHLVLDGVVPAHGGHILRHGGLLLLSDGADRYWCLLLFFLVAEVRRIGRFGQLAGCWRDREASSRWVGGCGRGFVGRSSTSGRMRCGSTALT